MLNVVHLVDVDQHQLVGRVVQPGQGGIHHVQVGGFILPGGEEPGVQVSRGDQLLKPVVTGGSRLHPQPAGSGKNVVLRHGWDDFIVEVHGGHIAQVVPGTGHQHPVTGRGEGWYTAVNGGGSPLIFEGIQHRHDRSVIGGILAQSINDHEDHPPCQPLTQRLARLGWIVGQR